MMRSTLLAVTVLTCLACSSTGPQKVKTTKKSQAADLTHYRTYAQEAAQRAPEGYELTSLAPEVEQEIRETVDAELGKKGYVVAPQTTAELLVRSASGRKRISRAPTGTAVAVGAPEVEATQAELIIDIFERESGAQLFHGFARDEVEPGKVKEKKVATAVSKILEPVPTSLQAAQAPASSETR